MASPQLANGPDRWISSHGCRRITTRSSGGFVIGIKRASDFAPLPEKEELPSPMPEELPEGPRHPWAAPEPKGVTTMGYLTLEQARKKYPEATFLRPYRRDEVVSEWQNMVLGGKHGAHKPYCSLCRKLDVPALVFWSRPV